MDVYKIKYSEIANNMLSHIYEWGKEDFGAAAARHFVSLLIQDVKILKTSPCVGIKEPLLEHLGREYRSIVLHSYFKFVYFVDRDHKIVYIVDIWDTRMLPVHLSNRISDQ